MHYFFVALFYSPIFSEQIIVEYSIKDVRVAIVLKI